ncbi:metal ABC transporter permease [Dehalococcoides mccartyi]|uniref:metal ABC transporter permease n=1 Tax=Dehalococcoides mccartyi TaxID=61435 RepID=UPI002FC6E43D
MIEALGYGFIQNAIWAGLLAAIGCGIIGSYVVVKKLVSISGGIAHASFGGIGLGYLLGISPVLGALVFSLLAAAGMGAITRRGRISEDTVIGMLWSLGMALGVIFIGLTPGYAPDLFSYLFGNILTVPSSDLLLMLVLDALIIGVVWLFYKEFLGISFDEEFCRVSGMPTGLLYIIMLGLIALTVVMLIRVVGIILVIALLTIPAAVARRFTDNLFKMMLLSIGFGIVFCLGGLWLSYVLDLASGATIILFSAAVFLLVWAFKNKKKQEPVRD